jgi:sugar/nucleoside kinase (ribokinase family)
MGLTYRGDHLSSSKNIPGTRSMWSARRWRRRPEERHPSTALAAGMSGALQASYVAVGHVTVDVLAGGERRPGGTALYSALQAARLGLAATILTRGEEREIRGLLEPFTDELEVLIQPAPQTTTFATTGTGADRRQRILAWAGPIDTSDLPAGMILHLAPVAAELAAPPPAGWEFVGLTPQGLVRRWPALGAEVGTSASGPADLALAQVCDAIVLSDQERSACEKLIDGARAAGATVAITAGPGATEILLPAGGPLELSLEPIENPADDLGAGDVYAAAFFTALAGELPAAEAGRLAGAAAALRMLGPGPAAIAHRPEIEARARTGRERERG